MATKVRNKKINDETYVFILKYFNGNIVNLNKADIKDLIKKNDNDDLDEKNPRSSN